MKRCIIAIAILASGCSSQWQEDRLIELGPGAIAACAESFETTAKIELDKEINEAYVYLHEDSRISVVFTHGSMGTFEQRSADYRYMLGCEVDSETFHVLFLEQERSFPLIEKTKTFQDLSGSMEARYRRGRAGFQYCCSQAFDEARFNEL